MSASLPTAAEAVKVLEETFSLMGYPARFEAKDVEDGSISVAVSLNGELPGAPSGRRGSVLEAVQYLVNKRLNRAPDARRWINLGLREHPAPRGARPAQTPPAAPAPAVAPTASQSPAATVPEHQPVARAAAPQRSVRPAQVDEAKLEVAPDEQLSSAARALAEAGGRLGRTYALLGLGAEDRARVLQAVKDVPGLSARAEGEGRNRRVAFVPDRPTPMPRQRLPGYDEAELEELDDEAGADED